MTRKKIMLAVMLLLGCREVLSDNIFEILPSSLIEKMNQGFYDLGEDVSAGKASAVFVAMILTAVGIKSAANHFSGNNNA